MARAKKDIEFERTDAASIERVIKYLAEKGATKKVACSMLNISYNTPRLDRLISEHITKKEDNARRRAEKRGKPPTNEEITLIISEYLAGASLSDISASIFRGVVLIKHILEEYDIPERNSSPNYFKPQLIPDGAVKESFNIGETVYSARYDTLATIDKELVQNDVFVYRIYLRGDWMQYAYQPSYELASLSHLRERGITI